MTIFYNTNIDENAKIKSEFMLKIANDMRISVANNDFISTIFFFS